MKIKNKKISYEAALALPKEKNIKPQKPNILFRLLLKIASYPDLFSTKFKLTKIGMERLGKGEPCLVLMNHSSFIDLKIATSVWFPKPLNIVCTSDGFIGKRWLMKNLGCIPTKKFIMDTRLVKNMIYALKELKSSVLLYPEAGYSFDGTATVLPDSLGKFIKLLRVPIVMILTDGAYLRDPLYNNLQLRKVKITAEMKYLLSPDDIEKKSVDEINEIVREQFKFDAFLSQQNNNISVTEPFRADGLERVLYRCPNCEKEGFMEGSGIKLSCGNCGKKYTLTEKGKILADQGKTEFNHIPNWFKWQRECVKKEIFDGSYRLDTEVDIAVLVDTKYLYFVGEGRLIHSQEGFLLKGCDGKLEFKQSPIESYTLNADYFWYEIGDIICIGNSNILYYCFPKSKRDIVAKARLATEEFYKIAKNGLKT